MRIVELMDRIVIVVHHGFILLGALSSSPVAWCKIRYL